MCVAVGLGLFYADWMPARDAATTVSRRWPALADGVTASPGSGVSGSAAAAGAARRSGRAVTRRRRPRRRARQRERRRAGGARASTVRLGEPARRRPEGTDLVVTSPGWRPHDPLLGRRRGGRDRGDRRGRAGLAAARPAGRAPPLARASPAPTARPPRCGCSPRCWPRPGCGPSPPATSAPRSWRPCCDAEPYDVLAVELSSFQLHWAPVVRAARRRRAQRRRRPPRLARLHGGVRRATRAGSSTGHRSRASTTPTTSGRRGWPRPT